MVSSGQSVRSSVFTTATALLIYWLLSFLHLTFMQSSLSIGTVQGAHKPAIRSGYQDSLYVSSVEPFEDLFKHRVRAGGGRAQLHHLFHWPLGVPVKAISPYSSEYNSPVCGYDARVFASSANPLKNIADPLSGPTGNVISPCDITGAGFTR